MTKQLRAKLLSLAELKAVRERYPTQTIVHCHGVFDVLHVGHLAYLEAARKMGDLLVVSLTGDQFVNKGPNRPYFTSAVRAKMLAALELVDHVYINECPTAVPVIEMLRPNFYVKGPDYRNKKEDITGGIYEEERALNSVGGTIAFTDTETKSSSALLNSYFHILSTEQHQVISKVKEMGGMELIQELLHKISQLKVRVLGEPIVDTYIFCTPDAISSKSPSISVRHEWEENYAGGSLAIANHLCDFVDQIDLVFVHGKENYFLNLVEEKMDPRILLHDYPIDGIPTPRKTRYITSHGYQRIFEVTNLRADTWIQNPVSPFLDMLDGLAPRDLSLVADFGHGMFEGETLAYVNQKMKNVSLNVQTNSSNFGFNPFTKYKNYSYLSLDLKEARVAYHDRFSSPLELARKIQNSNPNIPFAMTLGPRGCMISELNTFEPQIVPAFSDKVIDAVGAGDAFYGLSSLLRHVQAHPLMVAFLGNVFAGLKTKILGNKSSVSKVQLLKAVSPLLQ